MSNTAPYSKKRAVGGPFTEYLRGFEVLRETRFEYWSLQGVNLLDMSAYFALTNIIIVMLSDKFGYSDVWAGYVWTIFSAAVSLTMFFMGAVTDRLGIRRSLVISMFGNVIGRAGLVVAGLASEEALRGYTGALGFDHLIQGLANLWQWWHSLWPADPNHPFVPLVLTHRAVLAFISLVVLAPFLGMSTTVYQAGNRRFTSGRSRGAGFNLWYVIMNIGAFAGGAVLDLVRLILKWDMTHIITFGAICSAVGFVLALMLIRDESQYVAPGEEIEPETKEPRRGILHSLGQVVRQPVFWRFVALIALIVAVRAIFIYLHALYPKYWLRVIGPNAWIGFLQAFNPILVIFGLVLLIPILKRFTVYGMLTYGAIISTASLFVLAIPAWGAAAYITSILSLLVLTVGEVIWSPRLNEYTAAIAPRGQEGVYYGLSVLPWFIAKTVASLLSGHMLNRWIPEFPEGTPILRDRWAAGEISFWDSPSALFLLLGFVTLIGPIVAILLRRWFTKGARWEKAAGAAD